MEQNQTVCLTFQRMTPEEKALSAQVAPRLRAIMAEYKIANVDDFAAMAGAQRNAASNWINGYNLPPVWRMIQVCRYTNLTLDWIYRGEGRGMPVEVVQSLNKRVNPLNQPAADQAPQKRVRASQVVSAGGTAPSPASRPRKNPETVR